MPLSDVFDSNKKTSDAKKDLVSDREDSYLGLKSTFAGIGSGIFKIPEGFVSLGATLYDLGAGTDTAAAVEDFFEKINPFDDLAEETVAGELTQTLVSLGVPSTAGWKIASNLANKAIKAKKINRYSDLKAFRNSKSIKEKKDLLKEVKKNEGLTNATTIRNRAILDKGYVFGAGLGGGALADFVFADSELGTIGDELGFGPTQRDLKETEGRSEALRKLENRFKFAAEGAALTSIIGGGFSAIKKGAQSIKYNFKEKNPLDKHLKKFIAGFLPEGIKPKAIFETLEQQKNELGRFETIGKVQSANLERSVEDMLDTTGNLSMKGKTEAKQQLAEGIQDVLVGKGKTKLENALTKLNAKDNLKSKLLEQIDSARKSIDSYSNAILKIIPDTKELEPLRKAIEKNVGEYLTTSYQLIERNNPYGKAFAKYEPTAEAREKAYQYILGKIREGRDEILERIPESERKGISPKTGMTAEDQADEILEQLYKNDVQKMSTMPTNMLENLKKLGLEVQEDILKPKNLPDDLKDFFGEIKDPFYTVASTIAKQGALITEVEMLSRLAKIGKGSIFFENVDDAKRAFGTKLDMDIVPMGKLTSIPDVELASLYTTREMRDAFTNQVKAATGNTLSSLYDFFVLTPKSISQQAKTIFSPFTHFRNILSAGAFTLMNGNLDLLNPGRNIEAFKNSFKAFSKGGKDRAAFQQYLDYTRRGIVGTNTIIGELADMGAKIGKNVDMTGDLTMKSTIDSLGSRFGKFRQWVTDKYMAEDDFWKIYNYGFEQGSYKKAFKNFRDKNNVGEEQLSSIISRAKRIANGEKLSDAEKLRPEETKILNNLQKMVGKITGRKVNVSDPIFYQPKNIIKTGERAGDSVEEDAVEALIKNISADVTKNNIPNYAYVGDNIKALRKLPLGTFVAFPAEILRTGFNTIQRAAREIAQEETRGIGMRRMAGVLGTGAALPVGAVELGKQLSQFTDEDMEALRRFVPSWSENSLLIPTGKDKKTGKVSYMDLSYIYPYDSLLRPLRTVFNEMAKGEITDENMTKRLLDGGIIGMAELVKPFLSEAIYVEAMADLLVRGGRTREGNQVFRAEDPIGEKLYKGTMHVVDTFAPGSIDQSLRAFYLAPTKKADKYGRVYNMTDEALGIFGFRNIQVDPAESFKFIVGDFNKRISSARATFLGDVLKGGPVSPEKVLNEYLGSEIQRYKAFQEMHRNIEAAKQLGIKEDPLRKQLDRLPKKIRLAVEEGRYIPYLPSKEVRSLFYENALRLSRLTGAPLIDPLEGALDAIYNYSDSNFDKRLLRDELNLNFTVPGGSSPFDLLSEVFQFEEPVTPDTGSGSVVTGQGPTVQEQPAIGTRTPAGQAIAAEFIAEDPSLASIDIARKNRTGIV
jgi:hypothetical protein